jgi:hypothetical protein
VLHAIAHDAGRILSDPAKAFDSVALQICLAAHGITDHSDLLLLSNDQAAVKASIAGYLKPLPAAEFLRLLADKDWWAAESRFEEAWRIMTQEANSIDHAQLQGQAESLGLTSVSGLRELDEGTILVVADYLKAIPRKLFLQAMHQDDLSNDGDDDDDNDNDDDELPPPKAPVVLSSRIPSIRVLNEDDYKIVRDAAVPEVVAFLGEARCVTSVDRRLFAFILPFLYIVICAIHGVV